MTSVDPSCEACVTDAKAGRKRVPLLAFALVVGLFFLWAIANNLNDILIKQFQNAFLLNNFQAGLVQSAFYLGYFVLAIPAGMCMRRFGFKTAIIIGLSLYALGALMFLPAARTQVYGIFLAGLFIIASGLSFLETSANPLVTVLGPSEGAARRLNFAQSFNALGSITAVLIGRQFVFNGVEHSHEELARMAPAARSAYFSAEAMTVWTPYLVIACVVALFAIMFAFVRIPVYREKQLRETTSSATTKQTGSGHLLRNRQLRAAVTTQFFYVGAQVGIWSYTIRYAQGTMPGTTERHAADFLLASLVLFMVGRFVGTALMRFFSPRRLLALFAAINVVLCVVGITLPGLTGMLALVLASFFMSIMYPTIFAMGVDGFNDRDRKLGSSFLVMAIVGGAILTAAMGAATDAAGIANAIGIPLLCFAVVLAFALRRESTTPKSAN